MCDAADLLVETFELYSTVLCGGWDENDECTLAWEAIADARNIYSLRKMISKPRHTSLMHKPSTAAIEEEHSGFDAGSAAIGFSIGLVGFFAAAGLAKILRSR